MLPAHAKINLTLEVLGRRPDGYHEMRSILQTVSLADSLSLEAAANLRLECNVPSLTTPQNLALRAARLLQLETGRPQGALLRLEKRIPVASGLGGGASDAAAALLGLNGLWRLGLSSDRLSALAAQLGSDVPFFLSGGSALASGRGEVVRPLPPLAPFWAVLLHPTVPVPADKTRQLYSLLRPEDYTDGSRSERFARAGKGDFYNVFEAVAFDFFPGLEGARQRFLAAGAREVHLAGAGPTLFAFVNGPEEGEGIRRRLAGCATFLVHSVARVDLGRGQPLQYP